MGIKTHGNCPEEIIVTSSSGTQSWEEGLILPCHRLLMFWGFQVSWTLLFTHTVITSSGTQLGTFFIITFCVLFSRKGKTLSLHYHFGVTSSE